MSPDSVQCQGHNTFKCPSIHIVRELNISPSTVSRASGRAQHFQESREMHRKLFETCSEEKDRGKWPARKK